MASLKRIVIVAFSSLVLLACVLAQSDEATLKVDVRNAFVWGVDTPTGAKSWSVKDQLTGTKILKMSHEGVAVSSRMGFEKLHPEEAVELIAFTTTIVNNTETALSVEAGEITVDGHLAPLLSVAASRKGQKSEFKNRTNIVESSKLYCFTSGFLSSGNFLSRIDPPSTLVVDPRRSLTVSGVIQDPRHYSMLCSVEGCFPKGSIRYAIRVGGHEYVFIWSGNSIVNCGR
jgi:hypothetical protein